MKLDKYIDLLIETKKKHGGDITVWYSSDDEGNEYQSVIFEPSTVVISKSDLKEGYTQDAYGSILDFVEDTEETPEDAVSVLVIN